MLSQDVCPSVTRRYSVKTVTRIIKLFSPSRNHNILVFLALNPEMVVLYPLPMSVFSWRPATSSCTKEIWWHRQKPTLYFFGPHYMIWHLRLASISCWSGKGCAVMCDQQTRRSWSFQISHLRQHFTSFTWHCALALWVSVGTVPSVLTPCALIWVTAPLHHQRLSGPASETANTGSVGNQAQSACQTAALCVHAYPYQITDSNCRLYHPACRLSETIYRA